MTFSLPYFIETRVAPEKLDTFASLSHLMSKVIQIKRLNMKNKEVWKPVVGFEGIYEVSNLGRVKRTPHWDYNTLGVSYFLPSLILKQVVKGNKGYGRVNLWKDRKARYVGVHILVLEAFRGKRPNGFDASHIDGNSVNNKLTNLVWESKSDNQSRRKEHGTQVFNRGSDNGQSVLDEKKVLKIRKLYKTKKYTQDDLGEMFGVSRSLVSMIINRKRWRCL